MKKLVATTALLSAFALACGSADEAEEETEATTEEATEATEAEAEAPKATTETTAEPTRKSTTTTPATAGPKGAKLGGRKPAGK